MASKEKLLRKQIAIAIIENCKHIDINENLCVHCVEAAKIALNEDI